MPFGNNSLGLPRSNLHSVPIGEVEAAGLFPDNPRFMGGQAAAELANSKIQSADAGRKQRFWEMRYG